MNLRSASTMGKITAPQVDSQSPQVRSPAPGPRPVMTSFPALPFDLSEAQKQAVVDMWMKTMDDDETRATAESTTRYFGTALASASQSNRQRKRRDR